MAEIFQYNSSLVIARREQTDFCVEAQSPYGLLELLKVPFFVKIIFPSSYEQQSETCKELPVKSESYKTNEKEEFFLYPSQKPIESPK